MLFQPNHPKRHSLYRRLFQRVIFSALATVLLLAACGRAQSTPTPAPPTVMPTLTPIAVTITETATPEALTEAEIEDDTEASLEATIETPETITETTSAETAMQAPVPAAFVHDRVLYMQTGPAATDLVQVEDCRATDCHIYHLDWSPTTNHLLYYVDSYEANVPRQLRVADSTGNVQTITEEAAFVQPAGWSWDGSHIVFRTDTGTYGEVIDGPARQIQELWTVEISEDSILGTPELQGEVSFGEGCGGGGRSESANVYEREGGFAYGYLGGVIIWTPADILLYTDNCTNRNVSRFDLANDGALEPYPEALRSLSINATGETWVAINDANQLVTGSPDSLETTLITTSAAPELVTYGQVSGNIYYTTLEITGDAELMAQMGALDPSIQIQPFFDTTLASFVELDPATGEETELYAGDGYAYARMQETADGSLLFSRVQDLAELQSAVENGEVTAENWRNYLPSVDVLILTPDSSKPTLLLTDAAQYTIAK